MEALLIPVLYLIGVYVFYRIVRSAVRDGILDAEKRRSRSGGDGRSIGS
ncbi:hypothetical protein [Glycomyces sp. YM15]|nr:hypothetical protein [Glycomyces sp. YM15]